MCLTGVDYFSTLGYQPGIAFLAARSLSPVATLVLVLVTLFAAYPVYSRVAQNSPEGQGSISMLERLLPGWRGKALVLCLLGFAATDFIITMTLSAADATAHVIENPYMPAWTHHKIGITLVLLALLGGVFLRGFREAIGIAVLLVALYLALNVIVITVSFYEVFRYPEVIGAWKGHLWQEHGSVFQMVGLALILFPRLALGLSGFETGVAVMPLVRGEDGDSPEQPAGRIRNTRHLLLTAALIMSLLLMASSLVTTLLIPSEEFQPGGEANGRALAYLGHLYLGEGFGTLYDLSTVAILWFAGASAMAGLLNLVPRYLPRYGMAPDWARASRPLVVLFTLIAFMVTLLFRADVDAQGGAYATGVLVLMTSGSIAVTISLGKAHLRWTFLAISAVFVYTTILNVFERPEGIKIASFFIALTVITSLISRALRATELRACGVFFDESAMATLASDTDQVIRLIANRPRSRSVEEYDAKDQWARAAHHLTPDEQLFFVEIDPGDVSAFDAPLNVSGETVGRHRILRTTSASVPNAFAALLIHIGEITGKLPHAYFGWTEGNPIFNLFRFIFLGEGDTAPVAREVVRKEVADPRRRPFIHVS